MLRPYSTNPTTNVTPDITTDVDRDGIKEFGMHDLVAELRQGGRQAARLTVHPLGDPADAVRPVIDGVHPRDDGEQDLRGADVARRLLTADVLLAGAQRHAQPHAAGLVARHADDAARQEALVVLPGREEGRVRAAVAER